MLQQQQDSVGLGIFDEELRTYLPAAGHMSQIKAMVHAMDITEAKKKTSLEDICHTVAEKISRRGLVCLVSDLFVDIDGLMRALEHFRHYEHEVLVMHIMDSDELEFEFQGTTQFRGLEGMGNLTVAPRALREAYLREVEKFNHELRSRCAAGRIDYKLISTADHLDAALCSFLVARAAAVRKASAKK